MKHAINITLLLIGLLLVSELTGLLIIKYYSENDLPLGIGKLEDEGLESLMEIISILAFLTVIILITIRLKIRRVWKVAYFTGIVIALTITLYPLLKEMSLMTAVITALLKMKIKDNYFYNITEILIYGGIGAVITPLLNPITGVALLIIISLYDIYAVYYSKHMVIMAKEQKKEGFFPGINIKIGREQAILGGGDIAFPLVFSGIFIANPLRSILIILGAAMGMCILLTKGKKGKYYTAMPITSAGCITGLIASLPLSW